MTTKAAGSSGVEAKDRKKKRRIEGMKEAKTAGKNRERRWMPTIYVMYVYHIFPYYCCGPSTTGHGTRGEIVLIPACMQGLQVDKGGEYLSNGLKQLCVNSGITCSLGENSTPCIGYTGASFATNPDHCRSISGDVQFHDGRGAPDKKKETGRRP